MRRKKIQTGLAFFLIAIVIAVTAVAVSQSKSAHSEENTDASHNSNGDSSCDPGPYGMSKEEIEKLKQDPFGLNRTEPSVKLKDLPPLPPPFGTGRRVKADGTIQTSDDLKNLPPELQQKIEQLKARRAPWETTEKEGN